jgi:hypothetical protein
MLFKLLDAEVPTHSMRQEQAEKQRPDAQILAHGWLASASLSRGNDKEQTLKQACFQGYPESAVYVQIPIGSRNSAIHNAYHTSLRPSSLFEPRHPSLKVVRKISAERKPRTRRHKGGTKEKVQRRPDSWSREGIRRSAPTPTLPTNPYTGASTQDSCASIPTQGFTEVRSHGVVGCVRMILPQVHLRKPCYDFSFL